MLAKKFRLKRNQINLVYKKGKGKNFGFLGLKFLANKEPFKRFAIVIPSTVIKKVVLRNRLRRIMYDELSQIIKSQSAPERGEDYIVRLYQAPTDEKILRQKIQEIFRNV